MKTGWAPDFFLVAHDEFTGKLLVNKNLLGCGLAASQLAELVATEQLTLDNGLVVTIEPSAERIKINAMTGAE